MRLRYLGGPMHGLEGIVPDSQELVLYTSGSGVVSRYMRVRATNRVGRSLTFLLWDGIDPEDLSALVGEWLV